MKGHTFTLKDTKLATAIEYLVVNTDRYLNFDFSLSMQETFEDPFEDTLIKLGAFLLMFQVYEGNIDFTKR